MHSPLLKGILALVLAIAGGLASPLTSRALDSDDHPSIGDLTWIGEVVPGQGNVTLTAHSIHDVYQQIMQINPEYGLSRNGTTNRAAVRQYKDTPYGSMFDQVDSASQLYANLDPGYRCGAFATGSGKDTMGLMDWLHDIGGICLAKAQKCVRVACYNTTGIYVCNDNTHDVETTCDALADYTDIIFANCCKTSFQGKAGQVWSYDHWNVVVAYGNCNHPTDTDLPDEFKGDPGNNGEC